MFNINLCILAFYIQNSEYNLIYNLIYYEMYCSLFFFIFIILKINEEFKC